MSQFPHVYIQDFVHIIGNFPSPALYTIIGAYLGFYKTPRVPNFILVHVAGLFQECIKPTQN